MALNKFMHPRNLYRTPPDFAKLAKSFEEFSNIAKTDITGKVTIDFKNPNCLRVLTRCLLKSDFGLDVNIPEDRLVPTLPLRLNYILWTEDLLYSIDRKEKIKGLDIGTGACAIYPLLAAVKNQWYMLATESDPESLQKAKENIERNNLQHLIELNKNSTSTLLEYLFTAENSQTFDFCMCNPPFYSNLQELCESRSPARLPPKNGFTGSPQELITEGGELAFCRKIIKESEVYKDKIIIFTTMVGHKFNLNELAQDLKTVGVKHTTTEFCQGRVTRWGLAWTYQGFDIDKLVPGREKLRKKSVPIIYSLPELQGSPYNTETVSKKLLEILQRLKIKFKVVNKTGNQLSLDVKATENTWSNQRRKRRLIKQQQVDAKKPKSNESFNIIDEDQTACVPSVSNDNLLKNTTEVCDGNTLETKQDDHIVINEYKIDKKGFNQESVYTKTDVPKSEENYLLTHHNEINQNTVPNIRSSSKNANVLENCAGKAAFGSLEAHVSDDAELLLHAFFRLLKKNNNIILEMEFLNGTAGKAGVHQIMQFIKNNWK